MSLTNSSPFEIAGAAAASARHLAVLSAKERNDALTAIHSALSSQKEVILAANAMDVELAKKAAADGTLSQSVLKRLDLARPGKWEDMLQGILDVRELEDPARPEVIANITSLAIKSGNAAILKGGKESTESFKAIATAVASALETTKVPNSAIQLVTTRDVIASLLDLDRHIDLVIPRGSNDLVRYVKDNTRIPVLGHADGLCIIYIHEDAEPDMAKKILLDAKLGYPAACNAAETLLVHVKALETVLPGVASALLEQGVSLRCDEPSKTSLSKSLPRHHATILQDSSEEDYETEFLAPILAIKTIPSSSSPSDALELAITHINTHGSHHTDCILTQDSTVARRFQSSVDSACVFWNTSTRMSDGMRFGFGTEVGISTNKIHARGPVGLEGLMIYKYLVSGEGQTAGDYGAGGKKWLHEQMDV